MTCHWALSSGTEHLAIAGRRVRRALDAARAPLRFRHDRAGRRQGDRGRPARARQTARAGGSAASRAEEPRSRTPSVDVEYVDPLALRLGWIVQEEDRRRRDRPRHGGPEDVAPQRRRLRSVSRSANGRIAYIRATTVAKDGSPASSASATVPVWTSRTARSSVRRSRSASRSRSVSRPTCSPILSRNVHCLRLSWYDPATGHKLGGIGVPVADGADARGERPVRRLPLRPQPSRARARDTSRPPARQDGCRITSACRSTTAGSSGRRTPSTSGVIRALSIH